MRLPASRTVPDTAADTGNGYGASERRLGEVLRQVAGVPDGLLLAADVDPSTVGRSTVLRVRAPVAESLERIGLEAATAPSGHVDVVPSHDRWTLLDRSAARLLEDAAAAGVAVLDGAPFGGGTLALAAHPVPAELVAELADLVPAKEHRLR